MKQLLDDLRALGIWAPVRALYELTRRAGMTGRLLRRSARRLDPPPLSSPFPPGPLPGAGSSWAEAADAVLDAPAAFFGREVDLTGTPDWHLDGDGRRWPLQPWWTIDLRPDERHDVKLVWEPARHRHLVVLARAAAEADDAGRYLGALDRQLRAWLDQNPPEMGVHWYSNLELAVRALAWLEVLHLVGDRLDASVRAAMTAHLYHSGRHIVAELPYTLSSMRNNHLIGDAVGLAAIGRAFPGDRRARRWARWGDRMLVRHLRDHFALDGSSMEDSLGYRCFVAELLAARVALGDPPKAVTAALDGAAAHLARLGVGAGPVPHFGDWDGGTAVAGAPGTAPPESSLSVVSAVRGGGPAASPSDHGADAGGGIARVARGPWTVFVKAGAGTSHEHADLSSVAIAHGDDWVVGDPGNGSYNRSLDERDYFRTSVAHSVLRLDGTDQREPHRRFRWRHHPSGRLGDAFDLGDYRVVTCAHDAYERLDPPRTVLRACLVGPRAVVTADWIVGAEAPWQLSLPLGPGVAPFPHELRLAGGTRLGLLTPGSATTARGATVPFDGWWARDYSVIEPAARLEMAGAGTGPVVWAVWEGEAPAISIEGGRLRVDGALLAVRAGAGTDPGIEPAEAV